MKVIMQKPEQVYAYGTQVGTTASIQEVRKILDKFNAVGFNYVEDPIHGMRYIAFYLNTKRFGLLPVRVEVPEIHLKNNTTGKVTYRERESYRALVLLLKGKLTEVELGEPVESVFLLDVVTSNQKTMRDRLLGQDSEIPKLLAKGESG